MVKLLTTTEVADLRGCTSQNVRMACKRRKLPYQRIGHRFLVLRDDAIRWVPLKQGRPIGCKDKKKRKVARR